MRNFKKDFIKSIDFTDEVIPVVISRVKIDGLTATDVQTINERVRLSIRQQEIRQENSLKVASEIFSH